MKIAFYDGANDTCRQCKQFIADAGQLARCPGCGFAGSETSDRVEVDRALMISLCDELESVASHPDYIDAVDRQRWAQLVALAREAMQ